MRSSTNAPLLAAAPDDALRAAVQEPLHSPLTRARTVFIVVGVTALLAYPFVFNAPFSHNLMIMIFLHALMAQSWNIMAGYCGQISLGHAVFFGIGAYSSAYLFATFQISPWFGMVVGIIVAMAVALVMGIPTLRLRGHYFAIATLVIGEAVQIVVLRWEFFGAARGIWLPIVREDAWRNFQFNDSKIPYYFIALALLALASFAVWYLERSKLGIYFRAIREDPEAASSLGVNIASYKLRAFMLSAGFMSTAGAFFAQYVLVIDPESVFPLTLSVLVLLMAVMGGVGTLWGPIVGAAILIPISEYSRVYFGGTGGSVDLMIYGGLIVLISIFKPQGLIGLLDDWRSRMSRRASNHGNA